MTILVDSEVLSEYIAHLRAQENLSDVDLYFIDNLNQITECPTCGEATHITKNLTKLFCPNPHCGIKPVHRLLSVVEYYNITGIGEATAKKIIDAHGHNHLKIFTLDPTTDELYSGVSATTNSDILNKIVEERSKQRPLSDFVKRAALPGIKDLAVKIFSGYDSLDTFYSDLHGAGDTNDKVWFIHNALGIKSDDLTITSIKTYSTLVDFEESLKEVVPYFNITPVDADLETKTLVMSGGMGKFGNKESFYAHAVEATRGVFNLEERGSVTKATDFLVTYETDTQKVQKAQKDGYRAEILTPEGFIEKYGCPGYLI